MQLIKRIPRRMAGMSLIELMLAVVIGLIVLGGLTSIVVATMRTNTDNTRMIRLTQEMRGAMQLITSDLRRAGFSRDALQSVGFGATSGNPFIAIDYEDGDEDGFDDDDCVTYAYDGRPILDGSGQPTVDVNGTREMNEQHGVRHNADDLQVEYKEGSDSDCGDGADWEPMTDPELVEITALTFGVVDPSNEFPCVEVGSAGNVTSVTVREIQIVMTGRLADDPDVERTIRETVRVRNDIVNDATLCP